MSQTMLMSSGSEFHSAVNEQHKKSLAATNGRQSVQYGHKQTESVSQAHRQHE